MYTPTGSTEIVERLAHIRMLLRQIRPKTDLDRIRAEHREQILKDLITNLRRTSHRAMVQMLDEVGAACLLTKGGSHRLFGYDLDAIREYDLHLNGTRTHIIESYVFERDLLVDLPLELAPEEAFTRNALLSTLVRSWQSDLRIRVLDRPGWRHPGAFYVHIGSEDSLGSSLPPGATALIEPIGAQEAKQPNPRSTYLLQLPNGYRCSRCVATGVKLHLVTTERAYRGPEAFSYPGGVRIAGRVRAFALQLPLAGSRSRRGLWTYPGNAALILPWEHDSRWRLLATEHRRFVRLAEEQRQVEELLRTTLDPRLSERTRRRYRTATASQPHVDALIQMGVEHYARYSDLLRTGDRSLRDGGRFSLQTMLNTSRLSDLLDMRSEATPPIPSEVWGARRRELGEYGALFALKFRKPSLWGEHVVRIAEDTELSGVQPLFRAGSWLVLEDLSGIPDVEEDRDKHGWAKPLYVLRRGLHMFVGHLHGDGRMLKLINRSSTNEQLSFDSRALPHLQRVCGALIVM